MRRTAAIARSSIYAGKQEAVGLVEDRNPITGFSPKQEEFIHVELAEFLRSKTGWGGGEI
jgi:hypothetical protein